MARSWGAVAAARRPSQTIRRIPDNQAENKESRVADSNRGHLLYKSNPTAATRGNRPLRFPTTKPKITLPALVSWLCCVSAFADVCGQIADTEGAGGAIGTHALAAGIR
jgi:hypothetical protein